MMKNPQTAIELVAIDCDGTLLDSRKEISTGAAKAIAEVNAAGIQTALITGRNVDAVRFILDAIELSGPMVGCGGAFIYDQHSRKPCINTTAAGYPIYCPKYRPNRSKLWSSGKRTSAV